MILIFKRFQKMCQINQILYTKLYDKISKLSRITERKFIRLKSIKCQYSASAQRREVLQKKKILLFMRINILHHLLIWLMLTKDSLHLHFSSKHSSFSTSSVSFAATMNCCHFLLKLSSLTEVIIITANSTMNKTAKIESQSRLKLRSSECQL